jgi:hypothetical protein
MPKWNKKHARNGVDMPQTIAAWHHWRENRGSFLDSTQIYRCLHRLTGGSAKSLVACDAWSRVCSATYTEPPFFYWRSIVLIIYKKWQLYAPNTIHGWVANKTSFINPMIKDPQCPTIKPRMARRNKWFQDRVKNQARHRRNLTNVPSLMRLGDSARKKEVLTDLGKTPTNMHPPCCTSLLLRCPPLVQI